MLEDIKKAIENSDMVLKQMKEFDINELYCPNDIEDHNKAVKQLELELRALKFMEKMMSEPSDKMMEVGLLNIEWDYPTICGEGECFKAMVIQALKELKESK